MRLIILILSFTCLISMHGHAQEVTIYKKIDSTELQMVSYIPDIPNANHSYPAMVYFYGGGWNGGPLYQFEMQAKYFKEKGIASFLIDYRVKSRHETSPFESLKDAKSAIRFIKKNHLQFKIDSSKVIAAGASAGGHLAAATALIKGFNESTDDLSISCIPNALVLFNPVIDNGPGGYGFERIGNSYKSFSPLHNIKKGAPPTLFFLGTKDRHIPVETAKYYKTVMEKVGSRCDLKLYENQTHGFFNYTRSKENYESTLKETEAFLTALGYINNWTISGQKDLQENIMTSKNLVVENGAMFPEKKKASMTSKIKYFSNKVAATSLTIKQSPEWLNWKPVSNIGPSNLGDAPVALQLGDGEYWMFGRYWESEVQKNSTFQAKKITLPGFDIPLQTTPFKNQFDAAGGLKPGKGGYHAWQSKDMVNWIHHGPITEKFSRWMTTAEYVDGEFYFYYDFPNDQDPHLYIDKDLTDGEPGKNMGMAFNDPSHGSDAAIIRDLEGNFHLILEDWSPLDASTHAWDSPLAMHAVSANGKNRFQILDPPVDERTTSTGKFGEYRHPHWAKEAPDRFPGRTILEDSSDGKLKKGDKFSFAKYEIHEPEQNAYGDWAAISIGGQYYLFADFDPIGGHGRKDMSVAWFTSSDINQPFTFCGNIGQGHPDPEILFAEGQYYLITQFNTDFISPGPWVESVDARMGVDTDNDGEIDHWSGWQTLKESYETIEGFPKQIAKGEASLDLSGLPEGYGFQLEMKIEDTTDNDSKPKIEVLEVIFED